MNKKVVLIIPYFGKVPDYFNLWLKSAERNSDYTFFIYTDLNFKVDENSNVKIKNISFDELKERIKSLFGNNIKLKSPYKLCDYRPAYGVIFKDDITDFDFWGFCDIDLIFGNLNHFISNEIFENYDKLFYHGHFCLFKNCDKMNYLFMKKYENVCDFKFASHTNYSCHFDENGTVSYAYENEIDIKQYFKWCFYDVPYNSYKFITISSQYEKYAYWNNGNLFMCDADNNKNEIMYIHLQKRKMSNWLDIDEKCNSFYILRDEFLDTKNVNIYDILNFIDINRQNIFDLKTKNKRKKQILDNILSGALIARLKSFKQK